MREKSAGGVCDYFSGIAKKCRWFEVAVLPLGGDLKETYFNEIQKKEEVNNGREIKNQQPDSRKELGGSPGYIKGDIGQVQVRRLSVAKPGREGLLSRS
jgi:hypothetical protein